MANLLLTSTSLKGLFGKSPCTLYPSKPVRYQEASKGHVSVDIHACIFCGTCERNCPTRAIQVERKATTWSIDPFGCIQCGNCVRTCPKACLTMCNEYTVPCSAMQRTVVTKEAIEVGGETGSVDDRSTGEQGGKAD